MISPHQFAANIPARLQVANGEFVFPNLKFYQNIHLHCFICSSKKTGTPFEYFVVFYINLS